MKVLNENKITSLIFFVFIILLSYLHNTYEIFYHFEDPQLYFNKNLDQLKIESLNFTIILYPLIVTLIGFFSLPKIIPSQYRWPLGFVLGYLLSILSFRIFGTFIHTGLSEYISITILLLGSIFVYKRYNFDRSHFKFSIIKIILYGLIFFAILVMNVMTNNESFFIGHGLNGYPLIEMNNYFSNQGKLLFYGNHLDEVLFNYLYSKFISFNINDVYLFGISNGLMKTSIIFIIGLFFFKKIKEKELFLFFCLFIIIGQWGLNSNSISWMFDSYNPLLFTSNSHRSFGYLFIPFIYLLIFEDQGELIRKQKIFYLIFPALGLISVHYGIFLMVLLFVTYLKEVKINHKIIIPLFILVLTLLSQSFFHFNELSLLMLVLALSVFYLVCLIQEEKSQLIDFLKYHNVHILSYFMVLSISNILIYKFPYFANAYSYLIDGNINSMLSIQFSKMDGMLNGGMLETLLSNQNVADNFRTVFFNFSIVLMVIFFTLRVYKESRNLIVIILFSFCFSYFLYNNLIILKDGHNISKHFLFTRFFEYMFFFMFAAIAKIIIDFKNYRRFFLIWFVCYTLGTVIQDDFLKQQMLSNIKFFFGNIL